METLASSPMLEYNKRLEHPAQCWNIIGGLASSPMLECNRRLSIKPNAGI